MTPKEMQARSAEKVKQVTDLMRVLNLNVEAKERLTEQGFIEKIVFWIDSEKYEPAPNPAVLIDAAADAIAADAPTGETA